MTPMEAQHIKAHQLCLKQYQLKQNTNAALQMGHYANIKLQISSMMLYLAVHLLNITS